MEIDRVCSACEGRGEIRLGDEISEDTGERLGEDVICLRCAGTGQAPPRWVNLVDIVGYVAEPDERPERVLSVTVDDDGVAFAEECDNWFAVTLGADEVDRFISWLTDARDRLRKAEGSTP